MGIKEIKSWLIASPFLFMYWLKPRNFRDITVLVSVIPFTFGKKIRYVFYKKTLKSVGKNVTFDFGTVLNYRDVSIGDNVSFNRYNNIGLVDFGSNILTANNCTFLSGRHTHNFDKKNVPINSQGAEIKRITIGNDVWVGAGAIVMESVGDGCIIGAGSVVTRPIEAMSVAVGNPTRVIKKR